MLHTPRTKAEAPPALVLSELPVWAALLSGDGPVPDLDRVEQVDAAGLQLIASALLWSPGRLRVDPSGSSPFAVMWRRLGLDAPVDLDPVEADGQVVGFRRKEALA